MSARALLRSVASSILHGGRDSLRGGGARRSGPSSLLTTMTTTTPTSNDSIGGIQQRRGHRSVVGMAAAAALGSLATKRALHTSLVGPSSYTPTTSKLVIQDLPTVLAKARAGVAYVTLFGSLIYMYGRVLPKLESLEAKVKALNRERLQLKDCLTQATEALEQLVAAVDAPTNVSSAQSSGLGMQQSADKLEEATEQETPIKFLQAGIAKLDDLEAEISRLKIALAARPRK